MGAPGSKFPKEVVKAIETINKLGHISKEKKTEAIREILEQLDEKFSAIQRLDAQITFVRRNITLFLRSKADAKKPRAQKLWKELVSLREQRMTIINKMLVRVESLMTIKQDTSADIE